MNRNLIYLAASATVRAALVGNETLPFDQDSKNGALITSKYPP